MGKSLKGKECIERRHLPKAGMENLFFCSKTNYPIHESNMRTAIRYIIFKALHFSGGR